MTDIGKIKEQIQEAALDAVNETLDKIYERSQAYVPSRHGRLKSSGRVQKAEINGNHISGSVSYGDGDVDYAVLVHTPGTRWYAGVPYLSQAGEDVKEEAQELLEKGIKKALS